MSADLIWECVRKNHSFLRTGPGSTTTFSAEAGNLTGKNSVKYSGLLPGRAAGLNLVSSGKKQSLVLVTSSSAAKSFLPKKALVATGISKNTKVGLNAINKVLGLSKPGVVAAAKAKFAKLKTALRKHH
jgi:hypothetical protein